MDNFNLKKFLSENSLTLNSKVSKYNKVNEEKTIKEGLNLLNEDNYTYYLATTDTQVKNNKNKLIPVKKGTLLSIMGGGWVTPLNTTDILKIENVKDSPNFDVIINTAYPNHFELIQELRDWSLNLTEQIKENPNQAQEIINNGNQIINNMRKSLK